VGRLALVFAPYGTESSNHICHIVLSWQSAKCYRPVEKPVHMHDLHATLLYALGLDHQRLTYRHAGRDFRLTDVYGSVVHDILV
jgi:Protein of unknown function (DUF1501)